MAHKRLAPLFKFTNTMLKTYTGQQIKVLGSINVNVTYQNQKRQLPLLVVSGDGPSLLGQGWLQQIKLDWSQYYKSSTPMGMARTSMVTVTRRLCSSISGYNVSYRRGCLFEMARSYTCKFCYNSVNN